MLRFYQRKEAVQNDKNQVKDGACQGEAHNRVQRQKSEEQYPERKSIFAKRYRKAHIRKNRLPASGKPQEGNSLSLSTKALNVRSCPLARFVLWKIRSSSQQRKRQLVSAFKILPARLFFRLAILR
jgi:hypothetical protein